MIKKEIMNIHKMELADNTADVDSIPESDRYASSEKLFAAKPLEKKQSEEDDCDIETAMVALREEMSIASIFIAAKAHNEYRKLEHVIKVGYAIMNQRNPNLDAKSEIQAVIEERPWFDSISNSLAAKSLKEMTDDLEKTIRKADRVENCFVLRLVLAPAVPTQKRPLIPETSHQTDNTRMKIPKTEDCPKPRSIENVDRIERPLRAEVKKESKNVNNTEKRPELPEETSYFPKSLNPK